jgi:hypothetical protein
VTPRAKNPAFNGLLICLRSNFVARFRLGSEGILTGQIPGMSTTQLDYYFSVIVTSKDLPQGVRAVSRNGWCIAWREPSDESHRLWVVVLDEIDEVVDVPKPEILMSPNWSLQRRF